MPTTANRLFFGDNLEIMRERIADSSVDLVYLDPPFNSNRNYNVIFNRHGEAKDENAGQIQAFSDAWRWTHATDEQYATATGGGLPPRAADALAAMRALLGENDAMAYLVNMVSRLAELHRVLKPAGSLYLHCDPTMSHYLKVLLDAIFGPDRFRNEIIWFYPDTPGRSTSYFPRKHDVVLAYARTESCTFNGDAVRVPILAASKKRYETPRRLGGREYTGGTAAEIGKIPEDVWRYAGRERQLGRASRIPDPKARGPAGAHHRRQF